MHLFIIHLVAVVTFYLLGLGEAKAVFAHYMVHCANSRNCRYSHSQEAGWYYHRGPCTSRHRRCNCGWVSLSRPQDWRQSLILDMP